MDHCSSEEYDSDGIEDALSTGKDSLRVSMDNKHWVEELFPPAFGLTVDEILQDVGKTKDSEAEMGVFEKFARGIHPQDLSAIKNVYERVWLMATIEKEEQKRTQEGENVDVLSASKLQERRSETVEVRDAQTSTDDLQKYDIHDPCIWSDSEIEVLREVFQTARKQNRDLEGHLTEATQRLAFLEEEYKKQRTEIAEKTKNLSEALKTNTRLGILCQNLNKQLKSVTSRHDVMLEEIESLKTDRTKYLQEAHNAKVKLDKERLERRAAEVNLEKQTRDAVREQIHKEEKVRTQCDRRMSIMERQVEEMRQQLQEEKKAHERTKRGLDHLRTHFASLPLSGETAGGMVVEDQLTKWTF